MSVLHGLLVPLSQPCLSCLDCQYMSVSQRVEPSLSCVDAGTSIDQTDRVEPEYWVVQICLKQYDNGSATFRLLHLWNERDSAVHPSRVKFDRSISALSWRLFFFFIGSTPQSLVLLDSQSICISYPPAVRASLAKQQA